jgi:hypothetical protein
MLSFDDAPTCTDMPVDPGGLVVRGEPHWYSSEPVASSIVLSRRTRTRIVAQRLAICTLETSLSKTVQRLSV